MKARRNRRKRRTLGQVVSAAAKSSAVELPGLTSLYSSAKDCSASTRLQSQNEDRSDRPMVSLYLTWGMPKGSSWMSRTVAVSIALLARIRR